MDETDNDKTPPALISNAGGNGPIMLVCDHASNRVPDAYSDLGLTHDLLESHIAWDPGALSIATELSRMLDAPLVYPTVSRLVIDCNRAPEDADSIVSVADSVKIPGNEDLPYKARRMRIRSVYEPYHAAIEQVAEDSLKRGLLRGIVAIHSFEPSLHGLDRPWHAGVISRIARQLADPLIAALCSEPELLIGDNQPYSPADGVFHTLVRHAESRQLPCAMIEIRNDLIAGASQRRTWAERLCRAIGLAVATLDDGSAQ